MISLEAMRQYAAQMAAGIYSPHEILEAVDDDFDVFSAIMDIANGVEPNMPVRSQPLFEEEITRDIGLYFKEADLIYYVTIDGKNTFCGITEAAMYDLGSIGDKKLADDAVNMVIHELNSLNYNITAEERKELVRIFGF